MKIILCKNSTFSFDTIQLSNSNCWEPVVVLNPKCDIQLPAGITEDSLTFEENEYFQRVKEVGKNYHEKCGRHICVHLNFPVIGDSNDSLKVHGFLWEEDDNVEKNLGQGLNLKLRMSISMSVIEYRNVSSDEGHSFIAPLKTVDSIPSDLPKGSLDGDTNIKLLGKATDATNDTIQTPWPTLDPAKFKDISTTTNSTNKLADDTINKSLEADVDNSPAKRGPPTLSPSSEENFLVKTSKTADTSSTFQIPVMDPPRFKFGFSTNSKTEETTSPLPFSKISPPRSQLADKQVTANMTSLALSEKLKALRTTPACYLTHFELPLNFTRKMSAGDSQFCGGQLCQEYFTELQALDFPENIRSFLTQKLFQGHPFFLAGIINVSLISDVAEYHRNSVQVSICRNILEKEVKSDVEIVADNGEIIKCHKSFLAVQSKVFTEMMQDDDGREDFRVEMTNTSKENIDAFLRFLYTGDVSRPNQDPQVAFELLKAAHKYEIVTLEGKMKDILNTKLDDGCPVEVAVGLFLFLQDVANSEDLQIRAIRVMKAKPDELRGCELYQNIFKTNPEVALSLCTHLLRI